MPRILATLLLPATITPFEADHLRKTNRIALGFFALHLPAFVLFAWLNQTRPLVAAALTSLVLVGPTIAYFAIRNPRTVSLVYGVTAMAMGGLLVHFGQGPMQIEMHFYFFALIAMLAVFGNPMVIVAAAVTVALHHLALWFLVPRSVFNYDAPVWVVGVHAAFVVLESIASSYIARSFFDNVIGLEKIVRARTEQLAASEAAQRLVLDNVEQGFVTITRDGAMDSGRSAAFDAWFGDAERSASLFDVLESGAPAFAANSRAAWEQVADGFLPVEIALEQMPRAFEIGHRSFEVRYRAIGDAETPERFLVVVDDVTAARARDVAQTESREAMHMLERMLGDRNIFVEYFEESSALVARIVATRIGEDLVAFKRALHTLKGNSALFGIDSMASLCHGLETWIDEAGTIPPPPALEKLSARWARLSDAMERMIGKGRHVIQIDERVHRELEDAVRKRTPHERLLRMVHDVKLEPTHTRLGLFVEQAQRVAARLGKNIDVIADGQDLRLDAKHWAGFWGAFVHAIRNAVDHGVESPDERIAAGKSDVGTIRISTSLAAESFVIQISDDGPGVDWHTVGEMAARRGLPASTLDDVTSALFADGVSTARRVTEVSGRGVGMGALRAATAALNGSVTVESERGRGTTIRCVFAASEMSPELGLLRQAGASVAA